MIGKWAFGRHIDYTEKCVARCISLKAGNNIYLFIFWLCQVVFAACGLFVAVRWLLSSCGAWAAERVGSVFAHSGSIVVVCGLSCPSACGILVPQPGIQVASTALQDGFSTTGPPGKSPHFLLVAAFSAASFTW